MANAEARPSVTTTFRLGGRAARELAGGRQRTPDGQAWLQTVAVAAYDVCTASLSSLDPVEAIAQRIEEAALALRCSRWALADEVLDRAQGDVRLTSVSPTAAAEAHLALFAGAAVAREASLWATSELGRLALLGATARTESLSGAELFAQQALQREKSVITRRDGREVAVRVCRDDVCQAVLVFRIDEHGHRQRAIAMGLRTAERLSAAFERSQLLEWNQRREQALLKASEKRLVRTGYDLHDGPLQAIISLGTEIRLLRSDVEHLVAARARSVVEESFESVLEQVVELETALRGIAQSLETSALRREALDVLIRRELAAFRRRTGIAIDCDIDDAIPILTESQRIALYRVVQEALTNVREHSAASRVRVELRARTGGVTLSVSDDGRGFDPSTDLPMAACRGHLGLIGIAERIRLLGGVFNISSAPGQGTTLRLSLAHWAPPGPSAAEDAAASTPPYFS